MIEIQCCVCKRVRAGDKWVKPRRGFSTRNRTHGYCPECAKAAFEQIAEDPSTAGTYSTTAKASNE